MSLQVRLTAVDGEGRGTLEHHPARPMVRTRRVSEGRLRIDLFDHGQQIGGGVLHAERGFWRGVCSEFAGQWHVSGRCGDGTLEFSEHQQ